MRNFFVEYNGKFVADYMYLSGALKFVKRKGYVNDYDNMVRIFDREGNEYDPTNGKLIEY